MKTFLLILVGAVLMFVILKFISTKPVVTNSETSENFNKLLNTPEANKLISSPEFTNVLMTKEFRTLMRGISDEYLQGITKTLTT